MGRAGPRPRRPPSRYSLHFWPLRHTPIAPSKTSRLLTPPRRPALPRLLRPTTRPPPAHPPATGLAEVPLPRGRRGCRQS